jgi:hypothetical protein
MARLSRAGLTDVMPRSRTVRVVDAETMQPLDNHI